jgi:DNA-binding SARP family transcriptional activator/predicted ATPase
VEFRILGPLDVANGAGPLLIGAPKPRALLGVLLLHPNEAVSSERLIDELWGERPPATASKVLQTYVSQLRRLLGSDTIATRAPGYLLRIDEQALDATRFRRLVAEGRSLAASGDHQAASERYREALALWRGPPLADIVFESFARSEAERLEDERLATAMDLTDSELALGHHEQVIPEVETHVRQHPLRERLRAQLMLALYRAGRQAEALEVYREGRQTLAEELGIDPGPELKTLEGKILRQDSSLLAPPRPSPARFEVEPAKTPAPVGPPAPAADVRKTVTVAFADLTESTALGERLDPEALKTVMGRYFELARAAFHRHGGTIEKFIGDAVMAVFGVPVVHEDDALRAVHAAVDLEAALAELNAELEREWGLRLAVRVGVNTGEVVAGDGAAGSPLVTGDAVNTAARLQQAAGPGEILIGETTHALVAAAVDAEPVPALELKGKARSVAAWRVSRIFPGARPFLRRLDTRFVGRQAELAQLHQAFQRVVAERSAYLFTVLGAPGIGKSRLAVEFSGAVEREATILTGRSLPYGEGITYWPLREILQTAFGDDVHQGLERRLDRPEGPEIAERLSVAVGQAERIVPIEEIAWAARTALEALARTRPLIVILEDLHWAAPTFLDLVDHVAELASNAPILLLCLARPELLEERTAWGGGKRNTTTIELEPLDDDEASELVGELRSTHRGDAGRIVAAAEGNPLFLEQIVAMLDETARGDEVSLPPSIDALLAARLERLGGGERAVLERAAIVGKAFSEEETAVLLPDDARRTLIKHLEALVRRRFIRPAPSASGRGGPYEFRHGLIQEAAYRGLSKRLRAELHQCLAEWLEGDSTDRGTELEEILGYHLEQAYRYRVELGPADEDARALAWRAGSLLAQAGRRAHGRDDASGTCSLLGRATDLLPENDPQRPSLLALLGVATFDAGDVRRALEILCAAQEAAAAAGQRSIELGARMKELRYLLQHLPEHEIPAALAEAETAITELRQLDDPESLIAAWWVVYAVGNMRGDSAVMEEAAEQTLAAATAAGLRAEAARATNGLVVALANGPTPVAVAIRRAEQAIAEFPEERPGEGTLALLYAHAGRFEEAEETIDRRKRRQLDLGQRLSYAILSMSRAQVALLAGQPERAEQDLREGAELLEAAGETSWLSTVAGLLAEVYYRLGRDDEAEAWTRRCEQVASPEDVLSQSLWRSTRSKVLARGGEADGAIWLSAQAVEQARRSDGLKWLGDCLSDRAEVMLLLGRADEGRPLLEEAVAAYERKGIVPLIKRTRSLLSDVPGGEIEPSG